MTGVSLNPNKKKKKKQKQKAAAGAKQLSKKRASDFEEATGGS